MQRGALLMMILVVSIELLVLVGGIALVRRSGTTPATGTPAPSVLTATTMSPRTFGWWLIGTSVTLLSLSAYLVARFHA